MRIVLLNPYSAGSHAQWADGLTRSLPQAAASMGGVAEVELLSLPGRHWKWRMHAGALTLVERMREAGTYERGIDVFIVTDMMDVAQLRAALPPGFRDVPIVLYFHENQLTFPDHPERPPKDWDRHYAFMNVTGAMLADQVWFNSGYHRDLFLAALPGFLAALPSPRPVHAESRIRARSCVVPIGIEEDVVSAGRNGGGNRFGEGPPVVAWNHRWEYDKGPSAFLECLDHAVQHGREFRLAVMGQSFNQIPEAFASMRQRHGERIVTWGHLESRSEYVDALSSCDIALVTAQHDFFGISVLEAAAAGLTVVAPRDLAYPEHFNPLSLPMRSGLRTAFLAALDGRGGSTGFSAVSYAWPFVASRVWRLLNPE